MKMKLTDAACRRKPGATTMKLSDGGGLYLQVNPSGNRWWRLAYQFGGKQKTISLGVYPYVSLALARDRRLEAKTLLAKGIDPSQQRKEEKRAAAALTPFRDVAQEWFKVKMEDEVKAEATLKRGRVLLDYLTTDPLGDRAIGEIEAPELLDLLRKITAKGCLETAGRVRAIASRIFRYGIATSVCKRDPAAYLVGALTSPKVTNRPAIIEPADVGELMRDIDKYDGGRGPLVKAALQYIALTFVRPGEQRQAEWSEFDIEKRLWAIPADKMKMRLPHEVPLSRQALALLDVLRPLTGHGRYVFSFNGKPMSDGTVNKALRSMGYDTKTEHCAHGFRAMASTLMNAERHKDGSPVWEPDAIELCLAHVDDSTPRGSYNRAKLMPERVRMMQHWADRLDSLRSGAKIIPLKKPA